MKHKIKKLWAKRPYRKQAPEESLNEAIQNLPRITNETVAEHREEVLSSARKYIYPLQHSLKRIVTISAIMFGVLLVGFVVYCVLALYRFDTTSTFIYRVTQVVPFPIARAGTNFVAYENYLFQLRHYIHFYQTQPKVDFNTEGGRQQLDDFRKKALQIVVDEAYVKQLAKQHSVSVSEQEVSSEIALLRSQNRLGSSDAVFEDVLKEFWGWSVNDFRRELRSQLLAQKVVSKLDTSTHQRAEAVLRQLALGEDFAAWAKQASEDTTTKEAAGDYGIAIDRNNRDLPPQVIDELFKLQPGQVSGIIETPLGLEILKVREADGSTVRASHIFFQFSPISTYLDALKQQHKPSLYITP